MHFWLFLRSVAELCKTQSARRGGGERVELGSAKIWLENLAEAAKRPGGLVGLFHVIEQSEPGYRQAVEQNYCDAIQTALEIMDRSLSVAGNRGDGEKAL